MSDRLSVVVGVGGGMGQVIARVFAREGDSLALISRNPANMEPYKKQVKNICSRALIYTGGGFAIEPSVERTSHSVGKAALRNWVY